MKKKMFMGIIVIIMMIFTTNIYAQEAKNNHFAFGAGAMISIDTVEVALAPGLHFSWYNSKLFKNFIGLGAHVGVYMPITARRLSLVASGIFGAAYTVFDNGKFAIPITAGLHFDYVRALYDKQYGEFVTADEYPNIQAINLGIGAVGDFEWHFGKKWYAYGRLTLACNFAGGFEFLLTPALGMGFSK